MLVTIRVAFFAENYSSVNETLIEIWTHYRFCPSTPRTSDRFLENCSPIYICSEFVLPRSMKQAGSFKKKDVELDKNRVQLEPEFMKFV